MPKTVLIEWAPTDVELSLLDKIIDPLDNANHARLYIAYDQLRALAMDGHHDLEVHLSYLMHGRNSARNATASYCAEVKYIICLCTQSSTSMRLYSKGPLEPIG